MEQVKVVVPIYKVNFSDLEEKVLINNLNVLSAHTIVFVCPNSLDVERINEIGKSNCLEFERFDDRYFDGIDGYNILMLSDEFYNRFIDTEYVLICQTDAFVFRDDLSFWCNKGYDYIGGPWIGSPENKFVNWINGILGKLNLKKNKDRSHLFKVGNGGFSLRRISTFYNVVSNNRQIIDSNKGDDRFRIEDLFWSFKAVELYPDFKIPYYLEALDFSMDRRPARAVKLNEGRFPFGCHGLNKDNIRTYWEPIILSKLAEKK